jgi:hypothetical protein
MSKSVYDIIYNYPTKYQMGFTNSEIEEVLKNFPNLNRQYYDNALYGTTCTIIDGETITYHCDIENAIIYGLRGTNIGGIKWD